MVAVDEVNNGYNLGLILDSSIACHTVDSAIKTWNPRHAKNQEFTLLPLLSSPSSQCLDL